MVANTFAARRKSADNVVAAASGAGLLLRKLKQETPKSTASLDDLEPTSVVKDCAGEIGQLIKYLTQNHEGLNLISRTHTKLPGMMKLEKQN